VRRGDRPASVAETSNLRFGLREEMIDAGIQRVIEEGWMEVDGSLPAPWQIRILVEGVLEAALLSERNDPIRR
jgi:hypothetical protein